MISSRSSYHILCVTLAVTLSGCGPTLVASGAAVGVGATEERTLGQNLDDKVIKAAVTGQFLQSDIHDLLPNVNIEVDEGRVLLTGYVTQQSTASEAERLTWYAKGVKEVINEIRLERNLSAMDRTKDTWITTQIRTRLIATKGIRSRNYTIEVVDGIVYLLGTAQTDFELQSITKIASSTSGVKKVISHVRLKSDPQRGA